MNGLSVTVDGFTSPGYEGAKITRIHWDWGDGFSEDHSFPAAHTYGSPGTYTITVIAYQSDGLTATKILSVKVETENKPPTLTLYNPQVSGLTVAINRAATPGHSNASITKIHWEWGDGKSEDAWFPALHTYSKSGTYTVTVTVYQSDGLSTTKTLTVKVEAENKPPVAYIDSVHPSPAYEGEAGEASRRG